MWEAARELATKMASQKRDDASALGGELATSARVVAGAAAEVDEVRQAAEAWAAARGARAAEQQKAADALRVAAAGAPGVAECEAGLATAAARRDAAAAALQVLSLIHI